MKWVLKDVIQYSVYQLKVILKEGTSAHKPYVFICNV